MKSLLGQKGLRTKLQMRLKIDGQVCCYTAAYLHDGAALRNRARAIF